MINRASLGRSTVLVAIWLLCHTSPVFAQTSIGVLRVTLPLVTATDDTTARLAQQVVRDVAMMRLRSVDSVLSPILPSGTRFDVSVEACGRPDYLYDRSQRRVVLCTEMDGFARAVVRAALRRERVAVPGFHDDERDDVLHGFAIFAILHELGHAAIDMFQLPVPGSGEDAADGFAAYVLLARGESGTIRGAAQWFAWLETHLVSTSADLPQDHADGHALPGQRHQRLRCLLDGRMRIPPVASESDDRPDCQGGWLRLSDAWQQLLPARSAP
jgi:hypothetical protein